MKLVKLFKKMSNWPLGKKLFSLSVCWRAPYFGSIRPLITELDENDCTVFLKKRRRVFNHMQTVHAIAMCNACELAFGLTMEAGLRRDLRWIPRGMTVRYLKKAETDLRAVCHFPQIKDLTPGDHPVPVKVFSTQNEVVMDAEIMVYISEKPKK